MDTIRDRIAADLKQAMRDRDRTRVSVLRTTLASLANAEAVETAHTNLPVAGLYATEAERRELTDADIRSLLVAERDELRASANEYAELGQLELAGELEAKAAIVDAYLDGSAAGVS